MSFWLDFLYPKKCLSCQAIGSYLCLNCQQTIVRSELVCPKCQKTSTGGQVHPVCKREFGLDGLWSLGAYQDPLRLTIKKLKYSHITELADILANIILKYWVKYQPLIIKMIKKDQAEEWLVVPVPLHWYRANWRGFNQSSLIAKKLANGLGLEYTEVIIKTRHTSPQASLKGWNRRQNVKGVFSLKSKYSMEDSSVLLVDDVWTTGSTLKECCNLLKENGVKQVWALTIVG